MSLVFVLSTRVFETRKIGKIPMALLLWSIYDNEAVEFPFNFHKNK